MSGAIIVEGIKKHLPELAKMKQRIIIFRATGIGMNAPPQMAAETSSDSSDGQGPAPTMNPKPEFQQHAAMRIPGWPPAVSLNNAAHRPVITIAPGERQFFRVINASGHRTLRLNVEGEKVQVVAIDGYALDTYPGTPFITESDVCHHSAGRSRRIVVTGPPRAAGRSFRTLCYFTGPDGDADPYIFGSSDLVAPKRRRDKAAISQPSRLPSASRCLQGYYNTKLPPPAGRNDWWSSAKMPKPRFFINGKSFKMSDPSRCTSSTKAPRKRGTSKT